MTISTVTARRKGDPQHMPRDKLLGHADDAKRQAVCNSARGEFEPEVDLKSPSPHGAFDFTAPSYNFKVKLNLDNS